MRRLAVIGGSGFSSLPGFQVFDQERPDTPYGLPSAPVMRGRLGNGDLLFLPRHGSAHRIPPHRVNYRANLWALNACGAKRVVGLAAAGGITSRFGPGILAVPNQIIDYTYGRAHSFHDVDEGDFQHIDFTRPYCEELRQALLGTARDAGLDLVDGGTYGVTQGPRLETAAEILRMERDGCDLVGMTGMPEAVLARELGLCYASLAFVVNWAAGKDQGPIRMDEIERHLRHCMERVAAILAALVQMGSQTRGEA